MSDSVFSTPAFNMGDRVTYRDRIGTVAGILLVGPGIYDYYIVMGDDPLGPKAKRDWLPDSLLSLWERSGE